MIRLSCVVWCVWALACSFDSGGAPAQLGIDGAIVPPDAPHADEPPQVACETEGDCAAPPSPCLLAGTCGDDGFCDFPGKSCADLDDACNAGVCDEETGECVAVAANEGQACGAGTTCDEFGECAFEGGECDQTGTQSRSCTDFTCQAGACVAAARTDVQACGRETEGNGCGDGTVCGGFGSCQGFSSACDESGTRSRECTAFTCQSEACLGTVFTDVQACTRGDRDGVKCKDSECTEFTSCGGFSDTCDESGTRARVCTPFACKDEVCVAGEAVTETQPCSRDTDGDVCGGNPVLNCTGTGTCPDACAGACVELEDACVPVRCEGGSCKDDLPGESCDPDD